MKILSIGTGVIGTTYLWKFTEAGHEARVLVRAGKEHSISDSGIQINYVDKHNRKRITGTELFRPAVFISPINILYIPLFILVPLFRKMFSAEDEMSMLRGHYEHGKYEMMHGWSEVLETGRKLNVKMPRWESFEEVIKEAMAGSCEVVHNNN